MPSNNSPAQSHTNTFTSVEKKKKKKDEEEPEDPEEPQPPQSTISAILDDDEEYNSEEDSDFAPGVDEEEDDGNDSDSDDSSRQSSPKPAFAQSVTSPPPPPPTTITTTLPEEAVTNSSGSKAKPQPPKHEDDKDADDDFEADPADELDDETLEGGAEDTGPGGEIKTRAQRAKEQETGKAFKTIAPITVSSSVDTLWASMKSSWRPLPSPSEATATPPPPTPVAAATEDEPTYIFAGEVVSSLSSTSTTKSTSSKTLTPTTTNKLRRPKRRASVFDTDGPTQSKAKKLNTLEKSKLDWIGFTKTEGLEEELEKHGKGGKGFVERQEFLERVGRRVGK